jgi:hypothetical protein
MPGPSIISFNITDTDLDLVAKLNPNFEQIAESKGGVQGPIGPTGPTGSIGNSGLKGPTGLSGPRGTRWFVGGIASPTGGYGDISVEGDYWIDSESSDKPLFVFGPSGWIETGYSLLPQEEFSLVTGVKGPTGLDTGYRAIVQSSTYPIQNTFVFSDGTPSAVLTNPDYTNFLVTTDPSVNDYPVMEFGRAETTVLGPSGYYKHPIWRWTGGSTDYNILFSVPADSLNIAARDGITGGALQNLRLTANSNLYVTSLAGSISLNGSGASVLSAEDEISIISNNLTLSQNEFSTNRLNLDISVDLPGVRDSVYGNVGLKVQNTNGGVIQIGSTGSATGGNSLYKASTDGVTLSEVKTDGTIYMTKNALYKNTPTFDSNTSYISNYSGTLVSWYYLGFNTLGPNNTFILNVNPTNNLGVALDMRTGVDNNLARLIETNQCIRIKILQQVSSNSLPIRYLGYLTGSPPMSTQLISLSPGVNEIDIVFYRNSGTSLTGSKAFYYTAFGSGRLF